MRYFSLILTCFICLSCTIESENSTPDDVSYDVVILGGRVIDPETNLDTVKNVGILDGKIVMLK
jgi:hypothetical protein